MFQASSEVSQQVTNNFKGTLDVLGLDPKEMNNETRSIP
jgi:hypothetical protein